MEPFDPSQLKFDERGLIPAIVQDAANEQVLMLACMSAESLRLTLETGLTHFFSRSRQRIWQKGEESGHIQRVRQILVDCDGDALLVKAEQVVAACHTGRRSCFFRLVHPSPETRADGARLQSAPESVRGSGFGILQRVFEVVVDRKAHPKPGSYVSALFEKGQDRMLKKVVEEAAEVVVASKNAAPEAIVYEVADLWFHTLALLAYHDISPQEVARELGRRFGQPSRIEAQGGER